MQRTLGRLETILGPVNARTRKVTHGTVPGIAGPALTIVLAASCGGWSQPAAHTGVEPTLHPRLLVVLRDSTRLDLRNVRVGEDSISGTVVRGRERWNVAVGRSEVVRIQQWAYSRSNTAGLFLGIALGTAAVVAIAFAAAAGANY